MQITVDSFFDFIYAQWQMASLVKEQSGLYWDML